MHLPALLQSDGETNVLWQMPQPCLGLPLGGPHRMRWSSCLQFSFRPGRADKWRGLGLLPSCSLSLPVGISLLFRTAVPPVYFVSIISSSTMFYVKDSSPLNPFVCLTFQKNLKAIVPRFNIPIVNYVPIDQCQMWNYWINGSEVTALPW